VTLDEMPPRPWTCITVYPNRVEVVDARGLVLARIQGLDSRKHEEAIGHLLAAAPGMHEALLQFVRAYEKVRFERASADLLIQAAESARGAIERAGGGG
jgi:hypothetical protein